MKKIIEDNLSDTGSYDLLCLSHLRWDFVYQRPQHLKSFRPSPASLLLRRTRLH